MSKETEKVLKQLDSLNSRVKQLEEARSAQQEQLRELEILHGVVLSLSDELDVEKTLTKFRDFLISHFSDTQLVVLLRDENEAHLQVALSNGKFVEDLAESVLELENSFLKRIFETGKHIYIPNSNESPYNLLKTKNEKPLTSWLFLPLFSQSKICLGIIGLSRVGENAFSDSDKEFFDKVAQLLSFILKKVLLYYRTKELSITDPLTQLYNRRYLNERLEQEVQRAKRYGSQLTALLVDIDFFKNYNDLHGHLAGDEVLKIMSTIFKENTRQADIVARFGGEEFVILLPEIGSKHGRLVSEKLRAKVEQTDICGGEKLPNANLTISIGFATYPQDADDATKLLSLADRALYISKEGGRNRVSHVGDKQ